MIDNSVDAQDVDIPDVATEERQLTRAATDLAAEFPDVPHDVLAELVRQAAEHYEAATVRTFLPILVTKDVRAQLQSGARRSYVPAQPDPTAVATVGQMWTRQPA